MRSSITRLGLTEDWGRIHSCVDGDDKIPLVCFGPVPVVRTGYGIVESEEGALVVIPIPYFMVISAMDVVSSVCLQCCGRNFKYQGKVGIVGLIEEGPDTYDPEARGRDRCREGAIVCQVGKDEQAAVARNRQPKALETPLA